MYVVLAFDADMEPMLLASFWGKDRADEFISNGDAALKQLNLQAEEGILPRDWFSEDDVDSSYLPERFTWLDIWGMRDWSRFTPEEAEEIVQAMRDHCWLYSPEVFFIPDPPDTKEESS